MKNHFLLILLFVCFQIPLKTAAQTANDIAGLWWTEDKKAKVKIYRQGNKYFGKLADLTQPLNDEGEPKRDKNNPETELRSRPLEGLVILSNLEYEGGNKWEDGDIYDPSSGKEYSCELTLEDANTLTVRGYLGFSLLGRSQTWTRVK
ncbi:MAG: DUF2147 domain-containing protein [Bacteroidia bacterium]